MDTILIVLSVLLFGLYALVSLVLVVVWQIHRRMRTPAKTLHAPTAGEALPPEPESWYVSDAEQAQRERELVRQSVKRAREGRR